MNNGFIKIHRKLRDSWIWEKPDKLKAWLDLVMLATFKEREVIIQGNPYTLKIGEVLSSYRFLANRWKWSVNRVITFIKLLKKCSMIDTKTDTGQMIVSICNYSTYQEHQIKTDTVSNTPLVQHQIQIEESIIKNKKINYTDDFLAIWNIYPKKTDKHKSAELYKKSLHFINNDHLVVSIKKQIKHTWEGTEIKFIPALSVWLRNKRWDDEVIVDTEKVNQVQIFKYICMDCDTVKTYNIKPEIHSFDCTDCGGYFLPEFEYNHEKNRDKKITVKQVEVSPEEEEFNGGFKNLLKGMIG